MEPLYESHLELTRSQGIGVVLASLRRSLRLGASFAQRRLLVTLEIPSKDRSYPWFLDWMAVNAPQPRPGHQRPSLSSILKGKAPMALPSHELAVETAFKQHENGSTEAVFNLVPGPGTHYFRYSGAWFQVCRSPVLGSGMYAEGSVGEEGTRCQTYGSAFWSTVGDSHSHHLGVLSTFTRIAVIGCEEVGREPYRGQDTSVHCLGNGVAPIWEAEEAKADGQCGTCRWGL